MDERVIACSLDPSALERRRSGLLTDLIRRAARREECPDGLELRFSPDDDVLALLAHVIEAERRCCRFLRFDLHVEPNLGPITLRLSGPSGTREFLADLLPVDGAPC